MMLILVPGAALSLRSIGAAKHQRFHFECLRHLGSDFVRLLFRIYSFYSAVMWLYLLMCCGRRVRVMPFLVCGASLSLESIGAENYHRFQI
jgi:hypothetical protein